MAEFFDGFNGTDLDPFVWLPSYLPAWSSRQASAATYAVTDSRLSLSIPPEQGLWCPESHQPRLRVSGIQSGNFSGPVGSRHGQQRYGAGVVVRQAQPRFEGWLPAGRVSVHCSMTLSPRSMAAVWLVGFEDDPAQRQCGELCVFEVFGRSINSRPVSAGIGMGIKAIRDPALRDDFEAPRMPIDVSRFHTYAVHWDASHAVFSVDGVEQRRCSNPPNYPLQVMMAVFDFPDWSDGDDGRLVPSLTIDWVRG